MRSIRTVPSAGNPLLRWPRAQGKRVWHEVRAGDFALTRWPDVGDKSIVNDILFSDGGNSGQG